MDRVIVEKLIVTQPNKECPTMFIAALYSTYPEADKSSSHPHKKGKVVPVLN
jgi:hypothetical protein